MHRPVYHLNYKLIFYLHFVYANCKILDAMFNYVKKCREQVLNLRFLRKICTYNTKNILEV